MPVTFPPPELLKARETADLLGVSERMVWLLARQRVLAPVRIRRCTRWRRADVLSYIDRLTAERKAVSDAY